MGFVDGRERLVALGTTEPPLVHDCEYVEARNKLHGKAEEIARAEARFCGAEALRTIFSGAMDALADKDIYRITPARRRELRFAFLRFATKMASVRPLKLSKTKV